MTSLNDNGDVCRKSSVYNQTGQNYFQQLTAYNHMSSHLRRLLLAPSVVDARNRKYTRERDKHQRRLGWTCSCCFKTRRSLIEGLAYDVTHHPIDVLRMSLKCNSGCRSKQDNRGSRNVWNGQDRKDDTVANKFDRGSIEHSQIPASQTPRSNVEPSNDSYEKQYESQVDSEFGSPCVTASVDVLANKYSDRLERHADEAKYAKFVYDITQEIMINGLYTDQELQAIFDKHVRINSDTLDRDKMQWEIDQLRLSLNPTEVSGDEDENIERFVGSGRFVTSSPNESLTPSRTLYRHKFANKIRHVRDEPATRLDDARRMSTNFHAARKTPLPVDASPELCITERDVLVTLMEMKLDSRQVQTIRDSLRNKSRDTALSKTVRVDVETSDPRKRNDRTNSPMIIDRKYERRSSQVFHTFDGQLGHNRRDEASGGTLDSLDRITMRKPQYHCQCQWKRDTDYTSDGDLETGDFESAPKVERESRRESEKRTRKNTKQSSTCVSNEEHFDEKIANKSEDVSASRAALSAVPSQTELSMKTDYIDDALADISERSEEKVTLTDETATSTEEASPISAEKTNIEPETTIDELDDASDGLSQTDEMQDIPESLQLSEAEQVQDLDVS